MRVWLLVSSAGLVQCLDAEPSNGLGLCEGRPDSLFPDGGGGGGGFVACRAGQAHRLRCPPRQEFRGGHCRRYRADLEAERCSEADGVYTDYGSGCRGFFFCKGGRRTSFSCPGSMLFDWRLGRCRPATRVNCSKLHCDADGVFPDHAGGCRRYFRCSDGEREEMLCPQGQLFEADRCQNSSAVTCKGDDGCGGLPDAFYPAPGCHEFVLCVAGQVREFTCPSDLIFSRKKLACDYPDRSSCDPPKATCAPGSNGLHPLPGCREFLVCRDGHLLKVGSCPRGTAFDTATLDCRPAGSVQCLVGADGHDSEPECAGRPDGAYPDPGSAPTSYYACLGEAMVATGSCPDGSAFDPATQHCQAPGRPGLDGVAYGQYECEGRIGVFPDYRSSCRGYRVCADGLEILHDCDEDLRFDAETGRCLPEASLCRPPRVVGTFKCSEDSPRLFVDQSTGCRFWHECVGTEGVSYACPRGQTFDPERMFCRLDISCVDVSPRETGVPSLTGTIKLVNETDSEVDCGYDAEVLPALDRRDFHVCSPGGTYTFRCPTATVFDVDKNTCSVDRGIDATDLMLPGDDFSCEGRNDGLYPDESMAHECARYYVCEGGKKKTMLCPPGTRFNHVLLFCSSAVLCQVDRPAPVTTPAPATPQPTTTTATVTKTTLENLVTTQAFSPITAPPSTLAPAQVTPRAGRGNRRRGHRRRPRPTEGNYVGAVEAVTPLVRPATTPESLLATGAVSARGSRQGGERRTTWAATWSGSWAATRAGTRGTTPATTAITTVITTPPPTRLTTTVTTPAPTPTTPSVAPAGLTGNEPEIEPSRVPEVHRESQQEVVHEATADVPPLSDTEYEDDFGVYAAPIAGAVTPSTSKPDGRAEGRPRSEAEVRTKSVPQPEPGNVALSPPEATLAVPVNDQLGIDSDNGTRTGLSLDATTGLGPQEAPETILDRFPQSPPRLQADHNSKSRPGYVPDGSPEIGEGFVPQQKPGEVPHSLAEIDPYVEAQRNRKTESPFTSEKRPPVSSDLAVEKGLNVGPETSQTSAPYAGARHGSTTESGFAPESLPQSTVVYEPEDEPDEAPEGLPQTPQRGSARQPQNTKSTNAPEIEQQVTSDIVSQRGRGESQKIPPYVGARLPANSDSNLPTGTRQEARGDFSPEGGSDVALQRSTETPPYVGARHESRYQTTFAPESGQRVTPPYVGIRDHPRTKTTSAPGKGPQTTSDFSSEYGLGEVSTVAPSLQARRYPKTESQFPQEVGLQDTADFPRDHELDIAAKSYTESQPYVDAQYRRITKTTLPPEKGQQTTSDFASQYVTHKAAENSPGTLTPPYADTRDPLRIKTTSVPQNVPSVAPDYPSEYGIDEDSEIPPNVGVRLDPTPEPPLPQGVKQQVTADVPRQHGSDFAPQRTTQTPPYVDAKQSPRTKTTFAPSTGQQVTSDLASEYGEDEVTGSSPGPHRYEGTRDYSRNKVTSAPGTGRQVTSEFVSDYDIDKASEIPQDVGAQYQPKTEAGLPPVVGLRVPADVVAGDKPNAAQGNLPQTQAFVGEHRAKSKSTAAPLGGASVTPDLTPQHGVERVPEEPAYAVDGHHPTTQPKLPPEIGQRVTAGSTQEGGPDEVPESLPEYPQSVSVRHHPQYKPTTAPETGPRVTSDVASEHDVDDLTETSPPLGDKSHAKTQSNLAPEINSQVAKDFAPYYGTEKALESTSEAPANAEASLRPGYQSTIAPGETPEVTEDVAPENVRIAAPERQPKITADVYTENPLQPDARFAPKNSQENAVGFAPENALRYVPDIGPEPTDVGQKSGPQTVSQYVPVNQPSPTSGPTSYISPEYRESSRRETTPVYTDRITAKTRPVDTQRVKPQTPPTIPPDSIYVTVPVTPIPTVRTTTRAGSRRTTSTYSRSGGWDATRAPSWAATRGSARGTSPPPARATTATLTPRATPPASRGGGRSRTRSTTQAPETFNAISFMTYAPTRRDRLSTVTPTTPRDDLAPPTRDDVTLLPFPQRHLEATRASRFKCPKGRSGFFADFRSGCRRYHICFKNSSQVHECPGALLFNPISQTCDLPDKVTCVPPRRRACPNCKTTSSSTGRRRNHAHGVPSGFHFECGDLPDGFYPDVARRCHVFYRCHNGHKFPHYCKRGLLFNSKTGNCDFEGSVECSAAQGEQRSPNESA